MRKLQLIERLLGGTLGAVLLAAPALAADVPRPAPDLTIPLISGQRLQLNQYKGKVVALEFLSTTCPHCQKCSQILEKLYKEYGPSGFQPVGVAFNEMAHMLVADYVRDFGLTFPVGYGSRDTTVAFLQHPIMLTLYVPQLVFIDRQGVIRAQYAGTDNFFRDEEKNIGEMVESLLKETAAGKPPPSKKQASKDKNS